MYIPMRRKTTKAEFLVWSTYLADLLTSGIDMYTALSIEIPKHSGSYAIRRAILEQLEQGQPISQVFRAYVDPITANLFETAEHSGGLDQALRAYTKREETRGKWRNEVSKILVYPAILFVSCYVLFVFVQVRIRPELVSLSESIGHVAARSWSLAGIVPAILLGVLTLLPIWYAIVLMLRRVSGVHILKIPFDETWTCLWSEKYLYGLLVQIEAGISLVDALESCAQWSRQEGLARAYHYTHEQVIAGNHFYNALGPRLHQTVREIVRYGEQTGDLVATLNRAVIVMQGQIENDMKKIGTWLEPMLMLVMGVVVASSMYSVFGPMYQTIGQLSQQP